MTRNGKCEFRVVSISVATTYIVKDQIQYDSKVGASIHMLLKMNTEQFMPPYISMYFIAQFNMGTLLLMHGRCSTVMFEPFSCAFYLNLLKQLP